MLPEPPFSGFYELVTLMLCMVAWRLWGWRVRKALQDFEQHRRDADLQLLYDRSDRKSTRLNSSHSSVSRMPSSA